MSVCLPVIVWNVLTYDTAIILFPRFVYGLISCVFQFLCYFQCCVEVVDFLKNTTKYSRVGANAPRGVLLEGPPGLVILTFVKMIYRVTRKGLFAVVLRACYFHSKNECSPHCLLDCRHRKNPNGTRNRWGSKRAFHIRYRL